MTSHHPDRFAKHTTCHGFAGRPRQRGCKATKYELYDVSQDPGLPKKVVAKAEAWNAALPVAYEKSGESAD